MNVRHSAGSYEITITGLSDAIAALPKDCIVVTDENVNALYRDRFPEGTPVLVVPAGEGSKSVEQWAALQSSLVSSRAGRKTTVVAFGGGVVGDLAGFAAATFMRGIPLIQIPTTLLSQVDSSVGGKVGIDLPEGKNLVGSFYAPKRVYVCAETLETLPQREYDAGMAEVWKAGFIVDAPFVERLRNGDLAKTEMVRRCIDIKRRIVEDDEFETKGERAKLNFGHTIGHALERQAGFGGLLHGEAISIGMVVEAQLGEATGLSSAGTRRAVEDCLHSQGLPTTSLLLRDVDELIRTMLRDKKAVGGRMAFSLLRRVGSCKLVEDVAESDVRKVLQSFDGADPE